MEDPISNCCGWPPSYEMTDNIGYCSKCGRGALFIEEENDG
tara:strand:+ start:60 stop:182 length:123 start_codon:yes stop_codon:yes gene_type:complete